jgi:hypothetical protein
VVQSSLEQIPSADVKVYVVWEPIRLWDREGAAKKSQELVSDSRSSHFWTRDLELGKSFQYPIKLRTEPAWDVYLLYSAEAKWPNNSVPTPSDFMHQLSGRLSASNLLDETELTRRLLNLVAQSRGRVPVSVARP